MKIVILLVSGCLLFFPNNCNFQETEEILDDSTTNNFAFAKDRTNTLITRIIGGSDATPNAYPFQVALYVYMSTTTYFCGGTLISSEWVLTAAHCLSDDPVYVTVLLGSHNLSATESSRVQLTSTSFIVHEGWDYSTLQNDIALIRLPSKVTLSTYINVISYATDSQSYEDEVGTILGWGLTETGGSSISSTLKHVNVSVISNDECAATDTDYKQVIVSSHLCTSGTGTLGSCSGDSGGPVITNGVQIGIVSFGSTDCNSGKPSVFTRLTEFSDWIEEYAETEAETSVATDGCRLNLSHPCTVTIFAVICYLLRYLTHNYL